MLGLGLSGLGFILCVAFSGNYILEAILLSLIYLINLAAKIKWSHRRVG